jgi:hydroxymethylglutaryl-CoA lyase
MDAIRITDVSPRDGLQNQRVAVSTEGKLRLIGHLAQAGVQRIEVTSFVSPRAVPQMADAGELLPAVQARLPGLHASVLVPNAKGLARAQDAGAREIAVVLSATETMNRKNINMGLAQAAEVCADTLQQARAAGLRTRAYVAVAFDCPFEGRTPLDTVIALAAGMRAVGADEVVIADTIGSAAPGQVRERLQAVAAVVPLQALCVHLHDTRGAGGWRAPFRRQCGRHRRLPVRTGRSRQPRDRGPGAARAAERARHRDPSRRAAGGRRLCTGLAGAYARRAIDRLAARRRPIR